MISKKIYFLNNERNREYAIKGIAAAPEGYEVIIQPKTRSAPQNKRLWAMLRDVSMQVKWYGRSMNEQQWKNFFSAALLGQESVPNMDATGFIVLGKATSKMTVAMMVSMQDLISAFGAEHGVRWSHPE